MTHAISNDVIHGLDPWTHSHLSQPQGMPSYDPDATLHDRSATPRRLRPPHSPLGPRVKPVDDEWRVRRIV